MPGTRKGRRRRWEKEGGIPFLPPSPVEPLSLFISTLLRRLTSWLFKRLIALSTLKISVQWIRIIETNYVIHLIEVYQTTGPWVKRDVVEQSLL